MKNAYEESTVFTEEMLQEIATKTGRKVDRSVIYNPNGAKKVIRVLDEGLGIGAVFYEEDFVKLTEWQRVDKVVSEFRDSEANMIRNKEFSDSAKDWEYAKTHLELAVFNQKKNATYLEEDYLVSPYLDLYLMPYVTGANHKGSFSSIKVKKPLLEKWGVTKEEVFKIAMKNTQYCFHDIETLVQEIIGMTKEPSEATTEESSITDEQIRKSAMVVVTNRKRRYGASVIAHPEYFKKLSEVWDADVLILPSSIHEVITIPFYPSLKPEYCRKMVRKVNAESVTEAEFLSNTLYIYKREENAVSILSEETKDNNNEEVGEAEFREI